MTQLVHEYFTVFKYFCPLRVVQRMTNCKLYQWNLKTTVIFKKVRNAYCQIPFDVPAQGASF